MNASQASLLFLALRRTFAVTRNFNVAAATTTRAAQCKTTNKITDHVSAAVKDKISAVTDQAKEIRENFKIRSTEVPEKSKLNVNNADATGASENIFEHGTQNRVNESSKKIESPIQNLADHIGERITSLASSALESLKEVKISDVTKKCYNIIKEELTTTPSQRKRQNMEAAIKSYKIRSNETQIIPVATKQSRIGEKWEELKDTMRSLPLFKQVQGISEHPAIAKSKEAKEIIREWWDTSDSPVVHKIQDLQDTMVTESPAAISFKKIRQRDPLFTLSDFLEDMQKLVEPTLKAYYKGNLEALKKRCCSEVIDRCKAEKAAWQNLEMFYNRKILHISDVAFLEARLVLNIPTILVGFRTQQIYCVKDKSGNTIHGGEDDIHNVSYLWGMQLTDVEDSGEEEFYPKWKLREMHEDIMKMLI